MTRALDLYADGALVPGGTRVDEVDHLWASQYHWHLMNGYAARSQRRGAEGKPVRIFLHREIMGLKHGYGGVLIDHINNDPLDCRRANLRYVTHAGNCRNRRSYDGSTSKYSGVHWFTPKGQWRAAVMFDGKRTLVGYFDDEDEAGMAVAAFRKSHAPREGTAVRPRPLHSEGITLYPSLIQE
jgi:hypothetical protein